MKDIKDYLHLHMGCAFITANSSGQVNASTIGLILKALRHGEYTDFKLVLRKLSSMTEEEVKYMFDQGWIGTTSFHNWTKIVYKPEQFRWLLSKGFDLFGLIDSGLAIEEVVSPHPNEREDMTLDPG